MLQIRYNYITHILKYQVFFLLNLNNLVYYIKYKSNNFPTKREKDIFCDIN